MLQSLEQREERLEARQLSRHLAVKLTTNAGEVEEAQRLRYRVFAEELGARLNNRVAGVDADLYDPVCQHLIVRDERNGKIVGTYRILTPEAARKIGSYYTETEFDIARLQPLRDSIVEVGRSCIHPDYRTGAVITMLWSKLAEFMMKNQYRYMMGCASVSMADGGRNAANLFLQLLDTHFAPTEYRVFPHARLPYERLVTPQAAEIPPLLKGYLRAGAWVSGEPAWDPDFNTADLPILLSMDFVNSRYARHFLRSAHAGE